MAHFWNELDTMRIQINRDAYECRICDNIFTSPIQLTVHCIVLHGLSPCIHCMKLFEDENTLSYHTQTHHSPIEHNCSECLIALSTQDKLVEHFSQKHQMKMCTLCAVLVSDDNYSKHMADVHKITKPTDAIRLINARNTDMGFPCQLCDDDKSMNLIDKLILHYLYYHKCSLQSLLQYISAEDSMEFIKAQSYPDDTYVKCSKCDLTYTWSTPRIYHKIYCHGFVHCNACGRCSESHEKHNEHSKGCIEKITFCDDCTTTNESIGELHFQTMHKISNTMQWNEDSSLICAQNACNFCGTNLSCEAMCLNKLIAHYRNVHRFSAIAILRHLRPGKIEKKTDYAKDRSCNKRTNDNITRVLVVDGEDVEYMTCFDTKMVKYVFSSESDYDSSDSEKNEEEDEEESDVVVEAPRNAAVHQCDLCNNRFKSKFVHAVHMHKVHRFSMKAPEFRCNVCSRHFVSSRSLRKHNQSTHHKRTHATRFKCPFCEFGCNGKGRIRQHISEHVEASYHPCHSKTIGFNCRYCHFIFWTKEKLSEHQLNRHSDESSESYLLCSLCYAAFINMSTLRDHNTTRHYEFSLDDNAYQCTICRIVLFSIEAIRFHMHEIHSHLQSMYCAKDNCMQVVTDEEDLRSHWVAHHTKSVFQCLECFKMFERKENVENHMVISHAKCQKIEENQ